MAKIQINGKKVALKQNFSILEVLKKYKLSSKKVAIELNGKIIPQNKYSKKKLKNNDKIEIVQFIGGANMKRMFLKLIKKYLNLG